MTRNPTNRWLKEDAASDFVRLLNAAGQFGPQTIVDGDRVYEVRIVSQPTGARNDVLDEPGPLTDEEYRRAFGAGKDKTSS